MTAGNSTPLSDGAALVLLASQEWASSHGIEPLAYLADVDRYEIHEAFASQVLATLAAWEKDEFCVSRLGLSGPLGDVDRSRLNVHGSSLAAKHPFAATGGRITATLAKILREMDGPARGLISICAAGGQGITALLERS
jgi:acetyl-CoA C-acetyltransferase